MSLQTAERPIRVVHVITDLDIGGAEMMLTRLVNSLDSREIESTVVALSCSGPLAAAIAARGVRVVELGMHPRRVNLGGFLKLVRLLREVDPDVIQTWLYHADLIGLMASAATRTSAVAWNVRCSRIEAAGHSPILPTLLRALAWTSRFPAAVIANSTAAQRAHQELGYRARQWVQIPNGVAPETYRPDPAARAQVRRQLGVSEATPLIGMVARLHPIKDHPTFLRAAAIVSQRHQEARFVLAGRGVAESGSLREQANALGLGDRVHFMGEQLEVWLVHAAFDVAVSASDSESFPNTVIESMACGVPCVVTDAGDSRIIVADTGFVVPIRNPDAMANALVRMLELTADERRSLGLAARARVIQEYSLARVVEQYRDLYFSLAQSSGCRAVAASVRH
jgi:glycosyltransferase involved in cell wall biosynthesis